MKSRTALLSPYVDEQLRLYYQAREKEQFPLAFGYLENAHVLGQHSTYHHTRVHWKMLQHGVRQRDLKEVTGQLLRILGALTKTAIGLLPAGNTGGSNISPFKPLPLKPEHAKILRHVEEQRADQQH